MSGSVLQHQQSALLLSQRVDAAERRAREAERELQQQRQDAQMARRELDVYKQQLQEAERVWKSYCNIPFNISL